MGYGSIKHRKGLFECKGVKKPFLVLHRTLLHQSEEPFHHAGNSSSMKMQMFRALYRTVVFTKELLKDHLFFNPLECQSYYILRLITQ